MSRSAGDLAEVVADPRDLLRVLAFNRIREGRLRPGAPNGSLHPSKRPANARKAAS